MNTRSLKILQTCFSRSWGGLEMQALEACIRLAKRNHNVILSCCPGSTLEKEAKKLSINTLPLNIIGYFHPFILIYLSKFLRRNTFDIIHCQHSKDLTTIVPAVKLSGKKMPILLTKRMGSYIIKKDLWHQFIYSNVKYVLAISDVIRKNVIETTPVPAERVLIVHDAIDTEKFSPAHVNGTRLRREFNISNDTILIGMMGRFSPGKGHEDFLESAKILCSKYSKIHFIVVGEASRGQEEYEHKIRGISNSLGLQRQVTFTGFRKDVPDVLSAFDIFVFPSHAEAFGVALIEAMAMELPVVSTNCDGVLDIVVDGETGMYVNPKQPKELADRISTLIENPSLRIKMGIAGRKRVLEYFNEKKQTDLIEKIYYDLIHNPPMND